MEIDIVTGPPLDVVTEPPIDQTTKIGTPDFIKDLLIELNKKKVWRSLSSLATILHVDPKALSEWLDRSPQFIRRAGKEKGILYYALSSRIESETTSKKKTPLDRMSKEEENYSLGMLHLIYFQLYKVLKTYGLEISQCDSEAFSNFTTSLDKLESGLLLFSKKTKASMERLPKFN